jgi:putative ABC transport system permease protein
VSVFTLALGIGATTAIFSAVDPILFEPLPYPHANRIAMIWYAGDRGSHEYQSFGTYRELVERNRSFESLAVFKTWQPTLPGSLQPERLEGQQVNAAYFKVLGVPTALGPGFRAADDVRNGPKGVILSDRLWRRRFGANSAIVGRQITLDDEGYTVVGVTPRGSENVLAPAADVWSLLQYDASLPPLSREWGHHLGMVGRLRSGIGLDEARRELHEISQAPRAEFSRQRGSSMRN